MQETIVLKKDLNKMRRAICSLAKKENISLEELAFMLHKISSEMMEYLGVRVNSIFVEEKVLDGNLN
jgi:hypothetical protein